MATNPPNPVPPAVAAAIQGQLDRLDDAAGSISEAALAKVDFDALTAALTGLPTDTAIGTAMAALQPLIGGAIAARPAADWGEALVLISAIQRRVDELLPAWRAQPAVAKAALDVLAAALAALVGRVRKLLGRRPDVASIMANLQAIKQLQGGPADAEAFHDFHTLQVAFRHVWLHAFDAGLQGAAIQLYEQLIEQPSDTDIVLDPVEAIGDLNDLKDLVERLGVQIETSIEKVFPPVTAIFGQSADDTWKLLSDEQKQSLALIAYEAADLSKDEAYRNARKAEGFAILTAPDGYFGRLSRTLMALDKALNEKYAFDTFAPDSFNYGLMLTHRQYWSPGPYQAGNLAATIPLAPGETRKFTKRHVVKKSRAEKEIEKALSSRSEQASENLRAEAEIMRKVENASNFKMTSGGTFNIGIGSLSASSELNASQGAQSVSNKKSFQEATRKAAEEYRLERSVEVETSASEEWDETYSGEISNPNNELTVTYLFYELQRRYKVRETLYRVRPVILVAQDVPAPHEINEGWLIQQQWVLNRVILDDMFKPALTYLSTGMAGDEVGVEALKAQWERQSALLEKLERQAEALVGLRDTLRRSVIDATLQTDLVPGMPGALKFFTFGVDPSEPARAQLEAYQKAGEARLKYAEETAADMQEKLKAAASAFERVSANYVAALRQKFARSVAIQQLRVHVKENILYYMQAIWDHEPPDQRFFRLYSKKVICPEPLSGCQMTPTIGSARFNSYVNAYQPTVTFATVCAPQAGVGAAGGMQHELVEVADLDNPLGYKGNYMIFPLKDDCYLTFHMLAAYLDQELDLRDPDGSDDFDLNGFEQRWTAAAGNQAERAKLRLELAAYFDQVDQDEQEIIVPTGQLFVEALPGAHPLLEDFKMLHRFEDVRKVRAEVGRAELENIRLAARILASDTNKELLEDPDVERKVVVDVAGI